MRVIRRWLRLAAMYAFQAGFVRPALKLFWGAHFRRRHYVPEGPCIVVANHNSHLDAALLMSIFPLRRLPHVHPVAAADYFGQTGFRRNLSMVWMNAMGIERTAPAGRDVLSPIIEALQQGESLIFFPEGSRGEPGIVAAFRPGIGKLVKSVPGVLVLPVFISGAERSLPRGEAVPLPLGLDVIIGKPRTYSPLLDARDIAEAVRDDVLALAPPPPPVPGPRPAPPVRVACCGIDAETNRALFRALTERLGGIDTTIGIGTPILEADREGVREAAAFPVVRSTAWPRALAWAFRTGGLYRGNRFAQMVASARADEALQHGHSARFVVSDGSPLVDLLAWAVAEFHGNAFDERDMQPLTLYLSGKRKIPKREWLSFVKKAPEVWLLNTFDLAHPPMPDVLVLSQRRPEATMEHVRAGGRALEPYENERFLASLQDAYRLVASGLARRRVDVIRLEPEDARLDEAVESIEAVCRRIALRGAESGAPT
ncbi:MAG TPA: lysophospholipid acyltransferase family protein [Candidatus Sulfotelmatobacter sp.]|nr:lysophospholipid acyltransferase family protein [Candidatus Sulfotelmatobacter sp.]